LVGLCSELCEEVVEPCGHDVESVIVGGVGELDGHADLVDEDGAAFAAVEMVFERREVGVVEGVIEVVGDEFDGVAAHFDSTEIAELAAIIINMNVLTRLKLAQGATPVAAPTEASL
jgi:hypothetical protein